MLLCLLARLSKVLCLGCYVMFVVLCLGWFVNFVVIVSFSKVLC